MPEASHDAVVVGSGPNGLTAAITLAQAGWAVRLVEGGDTVGGGSRTGECTLPGFRHDICSAIHPLGAASPVFRALPLGQYGLQWIDPPICLAHPLDDGRVACLQRSIEQTGQSLGVDADAYRRLMTPFVDQADWLLGNLLGPLRLPNRPLLAARFGLVALCSAVGLARHRFRDEPARALFAGMAAHSMLRLEQPGTAAFGLVIGLFGHVVGWPIAATGSQAIADALAGYFQALGGEIVTGRPIESIDQLPDSATLLFDVTPRQLLAIAGDQLSPTYRRQLSRYRYGPGVFKVDWALDGEVPWRNDACRQAGTVHLGGTMPEIAAAERAVTRGEHPERPFVLVAQQSLFDRSRAPAGQHTLWAYCHVPSGSTVDMTDRIEAQIERFAPGFRSRILARRSTNPVELERYNPNYVGGDINAGLIDLRQLFTRPVPRLDPYRTSSPRIFLCSSSTPPGGGVHGLCGWYAARSALNRS